MRESESTETWTMVGRVMEASNAVYLVESSTGRRVYKPLSGERPLWDFPEGGLAYREQATYLVAAAIGWDVVPETAIVHDMPHGTGAIQDWIEDAVPAGGFRLVASEDAMDESLLAVVEVEDSSGRSWVLCHQDRVELRRIALLDVIVNNTDRKAGHVLQDRAGRLWAIDHGLTFHVEPKLRTALWGFAGSPLGEEGVELTAACDRLLSLDLPGISEPEMTAMAARIRRLLDEGVFPMPSGEWPALPWPIL